MKLERRDFNKRIARANDRFRRTLDPLQGRLILTPSIHRSKHKEAIVNAVRRYNGFVECDHEHSDGLVEVNGRKYLWAITYVDGDFAPYNYLVGGNIELRIFEAEVRKRPCSRKMSLNMEKRIQRQSFGRKPRRGKHKTT